MGFPKGNKYPRFTGMKHKESSNKKRSNTIKKLYKEGNFMNMGFRKGMVAWSAGLTKDTDYRLMKKSISQLGKPVWNKGLTKEVDSRLELSEDALAKIRANAKKGPDSKFWKGGITYIGTVLRTCSEYKAYRTKVFERDNYTCRKCGKYGGKLQCHHIKSFAYYLNKYNLRTQEDLLNCKPLWNLRNGLTLCIPCHKETDNYLSRNHFNKIQQELEQENMVFIQRVKLFFKKITVRKGAK